jgi:Domain of unknown function (DUF4168)
MRARVSSLAIAAIATLWLLSPGAASAQAQSPAPGLSRPSPNISDQKLDAAAAAIGRIGDLQETYKQQIATAPATDKERIANEAVGEMAKAVKEQGLSVDEYNSIIEVAQNDPQVRQRLLQRLQPPSTPAK